MPSKFWPRDQLRAMFEQAAAHGVASATLPDSIEAANFRFALYNFRRREAPAEFADFTLAIRDCTVSITRAAAPPPIEIKVGAASENAK